MNFKIELTEQQVAIIGQILGKAPYEVAAPLIGDIQRQIDSQQKPNGGKKALNLEESRRSDN